MGVELGPHQLKAIGELRNGSVLKGGVGVGKSRTAIGYYVLRVCNGSLRINGIGDVGPMHSGRDLYIITTKKKRDEKDWEGELAPFGISSRREESYGYVQITVDTWNNILKYKDVKNAFFIFDEQRLVGSGAWVKAFLAIAKQNQWIVLSATPGDTWMDYIPVFVANGFYKNRTEFVNRHVVWSRYSNFPKVDRYLEAGRLDKLRRRISVEMPYKRHTKRHPIEVIVLFDEVLFDKVVKERWNIYEERPIKDVGELFRVMRKLVNTDPDRLVKLEKLMQKHPRMIIFYNFNYELDMLREKVRAMGIPMAEWNGKNHEQIPDTDSWAYLVQYTAGAEGWNCITTDSMVLFSLNYSYKINEQVKGRTDRMNTPFTDLYYYIFRSNSVIDNAIRRSLATKKNFNEKSLNVHSTW